MPSAEQIIMYHFYKTFNIIQLSFTPTHWAAKQTVYRCGIQRDTRIPQ
jgi:hypothetical protein